MVSKEAAKARVTQLVEAEIPPSKFAVGVIVGNADVYWTLNERIAGVQLIRASYPRIRRLPVTARQRWHCRMGQPARVDFSRDR